MILFAWGDQYIKVQEAPLGMDFNETAKAVGFQDGDILLSADNVPFVRYDGDMLSQIADAREVSVLRDGKKASVYIPEDMMQRLMADSVRFASFRFPYVIDSVVVNSPAAQAAFCRATVSSHWTENPSPSLISSRRWRNARKTPKHF